MNGSSKINKDALTTANTRNSGLRKPRTAVIAIKITDASKKAHAVFRVRYSLRDNSASVSLFRIIPPPTVSAIQALTSPQRPYP